MRILYNVLAYVLVILALPMFVWRFLKEEGFGERMRQSLGYLRAADLEKVSKQQCFWLHAASVGEAVAASPIVKELRRAYPEQKILVSTVTATGNAMAKRIMTDADAIIFFPLDLPGLPSKVIDQIEPALFLPVETELWPNFMATLAKRQIPIVMVNGRISDRSFKRYGRFQPLFKEMLSSVSRFCMQSEQDAHYIQQLGAEPAKVVVTGNTKFDQVYSEVGEQEKNLLQNQLGLAPDQLVLIAGSTHSGEEEIILAAFKKLQEQYKTAKLILAPRNILRTPEVIDICKGQSLTAVRRTELQFFPQSPLQSEVVILDTIGELGRFYSLASFVFIGGSLIPRGGHNVLEPAAHGKPIIVGPHMFNFKDSYDLLTKGQACLTVQDAQSLAQELLVLAKDPEKQRQMGEQASQLIAANQGASALTVSYIQQVLRQSEVRC